MSRKLGGKQGERLLNLSCIASGFTHTLASAGSQMQPNPPRSVDIKKKVPETSHKVLIFAQPVSPVHKEHVTTIIIFSLTPLSASPSFTNMKNRCPPGHWRWHTAAAPAQSCTAARRPWCTAPRRLSRTSPQMCSCIQSLSLSPGWCILYCAVVKRLAIVVIKEIRIVGFCYSGEVL